MAAGMGSRYGGLKQLDGVGPHGEVIMDYSVYDALQAGFGKVVFVVRRSFEEEFTAFIRRFRGKVPCEVVLQEIDKIPAGYTCPPERTKPWGTNHAVMMGAPVIHEPFAVINADDYYGADSFRVLANFLTRAGNHPGNYCMVGFRVGNTLSDTGTVSRGVCSVDAGRRLVSIEECHRIQRVDGTIQYTPDEGRIACLQDDTPVSMNMWGFTPDYFSHSDTLFKAFLQEKGQHPTAEFYIPFAVNELIRQGTATVEVLPTSSQWFGVTYREDRPAVAQQLLLLHRAQAYPEQLF
jgi:dTDP-glucose pyrophosphorylase